jgi:hypothetical protein
MLQLRRHGALGDRLSGADEGGASVSPAMPTVICHRVYVQFLYLESC